MAYRSRILSAWKTSAVTVAMLAISAYGLCLPAAGAAPAEQRSPAEHGRPSENMPMPGAFGSEPLTELERMELHYRRYTAAANGIAQLFKQLNQKVEDISVAAKAAEVKNSTHNRRVLEDKLRQLESARASYSLQYAQLQGQMQNEYRSYAAIVHGLKNRYGNANASKPDQADPKAKQTGGKEARSRDSKTRESRSGEVKGQDSKTAGSRSLASRDKEHKTRDKQASDPQGGEREPKDPRVMDLDTKELRARRDAVTNPESGPTLNTIR